MALTTRQKNIVNPGASMVVPNYDFNDDRNKWVLEVIQKIYIWTHQLLQVGKILQPGIGPINEENKTITLEDIQAYAAMYPQNAEIKEENSKQVLSQTSLQISNDKIKMMVSIREGINNILTVTTKESVDPRNQPEDGKEPRTRQQKAAQLPAIVAKTDRRRDNLVIQSAGLDPSKVSGASEDEPIEDQKSKANYEQPGNIDFSDWTKNITPDKLISGDVIITFQESVSSHHIDGNGGRRGYCYYNPYEQRFYFVSRTAAKNPKSFDISLRSNQTIEDNFQLFKTSAIKSILSFVGKYSEENAQGGNLNLDFAMDATYGDSGRQIPPGGTAFWLLVGSISREEIEKLPNTGTVESLPSLISILSAMTDVTRPYRRAAFTLERLKENLEKTSRVLAEYSQIIDKEGITSDMLGGLDLSKEKDYLDSFFSKVQDYYHIIPPNYSLDKSIEFVFDEGFAPQWIAVDGTIYINEADILPFRDIQKRTFAYVFYSPEIAKLDNSHPNKEKPTWSEFLKLYTYELPPFKPTEIAAKISEKKRKGKKQTKKDDDLLFKTSEQISKIISETITTKDLTNQVNSALGSCGTGQAALLRDAIRVYTLMTGKTDTKALIFMVADELRSELIEDALLKEQLAEVSYAAQRPDVVMAKIEKEVNRQLFCLFDILGGSIQKRYLDPKGAPPAVKSLVRKAAIPPKGIKFGKTSTTDFFKAWRKKVEDLIVEFIKKIILDMFRDLVSAALGCGPQDEPGQVQSSPKKGTYGGIQINDLVIEAGDINLVSVAEDMGLVDTKIDMTSPQREKTKSAPTEEQMVQLNEDVSNFCTEKEILALLQGSTGGSLIHLIHEMIYDSRTDLSGLNDNDKANRDILKQRKESFKEGDTRYASINLTTSNIESYFQELGILLGPDTLDEIVEKLTDEDYCAPLSIDSGLALAAFGISPEQLSRQLDQQYNAKLERIKTLCDINADLNLQLQIEDYWRNLENPKWYTDFLKWISDASNAMFAAVAAATAATSNRLTTDASIPPYENTKMWQNAGDQEWAEEYPHLDIGVVADGTDTVDFYPDNGGVVWRVHGLQFRRNTHHGIITDESGKEIAKVTFADSNLNSIENNYDWNYSLQRTNDVKGQPSQLGFANDPDTGIPIADDQGNVRNIPLITRSIAEGINEAIYQSSRYSFGPDIGHDDWRTIRGKIGAGTDDATVQEIYRLRMISSIFAPAGLNYQRLAVWFYTYSTYLERLPEFLRQVNKPVFSPNVDKCKDPRDEVIATAVLNGIQRRTAQFMLNVGVMHSAVYWGQPDTLSVLSSYLATKFKNELMEEGIYGAYLKATDSVVRTYSEDRTAGEIVLDFPSEIVGNSEKQFEYITLQLMKKMRENIAISGYQGLNGAFDDEPFTDAYIEATRWLKGNSGTVNGGYRSSILQSAADGQNVSHIAYGMNYYVNERDDIPDATKEYFLSQDPTWQAHQNQERPMNKQLLMSVIQYPVTVAMQIIWMDHHIKPTELESSFALNLRKATAVADDSVLSALSEKHITTISEQFSRFPTNINGASYYFAEEIDEDLARLHEMKQDFLELVELRQTLIPILKKAEEWLLVAEDEFHQRDRLAYGMGGGDLPQDGFEQQPLGVSQLTGPELPSGPFRIYKFGGGIGLRQIYNTYALLFKRRLPGRIPGVYGEGEAYWTPGDGIVEDAFSGWLPPEKIQTEEFLFGYSSGRDDTGVTTAIKNAINRELRSAIQYAADFADGNARYTPHPELEAYDPNTRGRPTIQVISFVKERLDAATSPLLDYHQKVNHFVRKYMDLPLDSGRNRLNGDFYSTTWEGSPIGSYKQDVAWLGKYQYVNAPAEWRLFREMRDPKTFTEGFIQGLIDNLNAIKEEL